MNNSNWGDWGTPQNFCAHHFDFGDERGKSYLHGQILCSQKVKRSEEKICFS